MEHSVYPRCTQRAIMEANTMQETALLELRGICKFFPGVRALDGVDFTLRKGEIHALMGENGAGKSTLIKVLTGVYSKDEGTISMEGTPVQIRTTQDALKAGISTVYQEITLCPNLTVAENLYIGRTKGAFTNWRKMNAGAKKLLSSLGIPAAPTQQLSSCSIAVQQMVAIARAVDMECKVLILDEPTSSLDEQEVEKLFKLMLDLKSRGVGIIFVTHFLEQVYAVCDRITVLRLGEVVGTVNCADTDSQKLAGMMIGRELQQSQYEKKDVEAGAVISLQNIDYHKESKHAGLNDVSLSIGRGEIVGIAGVDGNGQTQLAQLLTGVLSPESGEFQRKGQKIAVFSPRASIEDDVALIPEDRNLQGLIGNMSIADNLVLKQTDEPQFSSLHGLHMKKKTISAYAREMIGKYDIRCQSSDQEVRNLSGGNQQKVILARELESDPDVLIAVHPTRGLDIGATRFVHDQMIAARDRGVGILLISADFDEILEMSDRILVIFEGQIMGEYSGKNPPIEEISLAMTGK